MEVKKRSDKIINNYAKYSHKEERERVFVCVCVCVCV